MRYYIGTCNYKWSHARTAMEKIWVQREVGDDLYKTVEQNNWTWILLRSEAPDLPGDIYCRSDIFVETTDNKNATHFVLKFPHVKLIEKI